MFMVTHYARKSRRATMPTLHFGDRLPRASAAFHRLRGLHPLTLPSRQTGNEGYDSSAGYALHFTAPSPAVTPRISSLIFIEQ